MASTIQQAKITGLTTYLPAVAGKLTQYEEIYEKNRHRVYSLAFWMTDNELAADELTGNVFKRAFAYYSEPTAELIDRALIAELREIVALGTLTLDCAPATEVASVRRNTKRVHLERAVVQLPATERLIFLMHDVENYDHRRIAGYLGVTEDESRVGLHQARLRMRELLVSMQA
jgi:RNA polymerase sigma-70 factor (ECF subfamily)